LNGGVGVAFRCGGRGERFLVGAWEGAGNPTRGRWQESMDSKGWMLSARDGMVSLRDARRTDGGNCLHWLHRWGACRLATIASR